MVYDTIDNLHRYASIHPAIALADRMIRDGVLATLPAGSNPTERDDMRCQINIYMTEGEEKAYEWHKVEADLQVMLSGRERCLWSSQQGDLGDPAFEKGDIAFTDAEKSEECLLKEGTFVLYLPGELHKPGVSVQGEARQNRKAVFKIRF